MIRCSLSLAASSARVKREPDDRDVAALAQQVGHRAEVVLVAVREHDGLDVVEAVPDVGEVREDQVDAGLLLLGEQHAAVDDQQPAGVLEDGHVATDLAEAAEGDDAQAAVRAARGGGPSSGCGWLMRARTVTARTLRGRGRRAGPRPARGWRRRGAGGRGRREPGAARSAALTRMVPWVRKMPV